MIIDAFIPAAMYAETHFRFFGRTPSALFRREPEIVFDLPRRLAAGADLPVILLINDIDKYPIDADSVKITVSKPDDKPLLFEFDRPRIPDSLINSPVNCQSAYVFTIPRNELPDNCEIFVNACLKYQRIKNGVKQKSIHTVLNDNLATSTKFAYRCVIGNEDYPGSDICAYGDLHCHSIFSRSHVEWGPPFEAIDKIAAASGLTFAAITDHSYDLACEPENYLRQDKELKLWELYKSSIDDYKGAAVLIPSEEISVLNSKGKVVHLCGLGVTDYIPGSLDGARKNIRGDKQLTITEAVREIERQGGISFAAHPGVKAGMLQSVFLKRGSWDFDDLCSNLNGIQAVNGDFFYSWIRAKRLWVSMLLKGRRVPILAGSDAHGDFNRYRAVGVPFWRIYEGQERYMGYVRTGVYGKRNGMADIMDGIRNAATFVTNGHYADICDGRRPKVSLIGSKSVDVKESAYLHARAISSKEFGPIDAVKVIMGKIGATEEKLIINEKLPPDTYEAQIPIPAENIPKNEPCYLRVESYGKTPRGLPVCAASGACFIDIV